MHLRKMGDKDTLGRNIEATPLDETAKKMFLAASSSFIQ